MTEKNSVAEQCLALRNHELQYSLWQANIDVPAGWDIVFGPETKEACLAHIEAEWTDMRPLSLRQRMDGQTVS